MIAYRRRRALAFLGVQAIDVQRFRARASGFTRRSMLGTGAAAFVSSAAHAERVATALVLAADISSSVDAARFALQRHGYAAALADERVIRAIQETPAGVIGVCYFEWAGSLHQKVVLPWTTVANAADGMRIAAILDAAPRPFDGWTGIGPAIEFAIAAHGASPFDAAERVIDISGDGPQNDGNPPAEARDRAVAQGIRVNGLPIRGASDELPPMGTLAEYYEDNVRGGAGAFVIEAESFESFSATLIAKLRREIG
jgi:hypothetical protein